MSFLYASKKYRIYGYLDTNIILDEFYKSDDFMMKNGKSLLEYYSDKEGIHQPSTMQYPRFRVQTTNAFGDMINVFLQYTYTQDIEKKKVLLTKLKKIVKNIDISSNSDFEALENMYIRYLLRNMYFFEASRRRKDTNVILSTKEIEIPSVISSNHFLNDTFQFIIRSDDYHKILNSVSKSGNRKKEIESILKYYK